MKKFRYSMKYAAVAGMIGIVLCASMLSVTTYAFFSQAITSPPSTVESANYVLSADIPTATRTELGDGRVSFLLSAGTHTVTVTASGTATKGFGFFSTEETTYYTDIVYATGGENQLSFDFVCGSDETLLYDYQWGGNASAGRTIIKQGETVTL